MIDATALLPEATGVDVYILRLLEHLVRIDHDNEYRALINVEDRGRVAASASNIRAIPVSRRPRAARLFAQQVVLPLYAMALNADVVHSPSFIMPLYRGRAQHVLTIHDMTSFTHPFLHTPLRRSRAYAMAVRTSIRRADVVAVPSQHTRQSLIDVVPGVSPARVKVIASGVSNEFSAETSTNDAQVLSRLGLNRPYLLFVGTIEPRKNLSTLIQAYRELLRTSSSIPDLVLVGRLGWQYEELLREIARLDLRDRVHQIGYATREDLPAVYRGARLFVYPSIAEGFGFPPLEAMACGVPTISSRTSALFEALDGAACLVDPEDVRQLADAMRMLLADEIERNRFRTAGIERAASFSWEATARDTLRCYESLVAPKGAAAASSAGSQRSSRA